MALALRLGFDLVYADGSSRDLAAIEHKVIVLAYEGYNGNTLALVLGCRMLAFRSKTHTHTDTHNRPLNLNPAHITFRPDTHTLSQAQPYPYPWPYDNLTLIDLGSVAVCLNPVSVQPRAASVCRRRAGR